LRAKLIINPSSGKQVLQKRLDRIIGHLVLEQVIQSFDVFTTQKRFEAYEETKKIKKGEYDLIIVAGGDGTVNEVASGVIEGKSEIPIAILPAGTVNDFAGWLNIPRDTKGFCTMIEQFQTIPVDVGKMGDKYFINVAAGGLLTDVGYKASLELKTVLGKFAYFVEGMKEIPKQAFRSIVLDIECEELKGREEIFMFIVANTPSVGSFKRFAPKAKIDDGLLDVCIIKKTDFADLIGLFLQIIAGEHIHHPKVLYIQTSKINLQCDVVDLNLDLDGEQGGNLPATIEVVPKAIRVIVP